MSQLVIAQVFVFAALVMIFVHRWVTNRWLAAHIARHGRLPGRDWYRTTDSDPVVETWRRRRLAVLIPTALLFGLAITLLITAR